MSRKLPIAIVSFFILFITGCSNDNTSKSDSDYEKTKKMVVDILQTEDGKKALSEILTDDKMKEKLVIKSDDVRTSITGVLKSDQGKEMWMNLFNDPSFVKVYAESLSDEQEELMKKLMNDAEYQSKMLDLLQNPSINKQMLSVLKGQKFRSHIEDIIKETLDTPLFQEKMATILLQAAEKKEENETQDEDKSEDQGNEDEDDDEDEDEEEDEDEGDDEDEDEDEDENTEHDMGGM